MAKKKELNIPLEVERVMLDMHFNGNKMVDIYNYVNNAMNKFIAMSTFRVRYDEIITKAMKDIAPEKKNTETFLQMDVLDNIDLKTWMEGNISVYDRFVGEVVPYSYSGREYLLDIHYSMITRGRDTVWLKSRQVEASTSTIDVMMYLLTNTTISVGHVFPSRDKASRFSKEKMGEFLLYNGTFNDRAYKKSQSILERGFYNNSGNLSWYRFVFVGTGASLSEDARSLTFDALVLDEFDDMPMGSMGVLMGSMLHSPFKKIITLFTPKLPSSPSIKKWEQSTKNHFYFKCQECGTYNYITFDHIKLDVDKKKHIYACENCGKELSKKLDVTYNGDRKRWEVDPKYGKWVADNPDGIHDGYFVNQLMLPNLTAEDIFRMSIDPLISKRAFYNEILGHTFAGEEAPLTFEYLTTLKDKDLMFGLVPATTVKLVMGIDWGKVSNYVKVALLKNGTSVIYEHGELTGSTTDQLDKVYEHMRRDPSMIIVVDSGYDLGRTLKLQERFGNRVWGCSYKGEGYPEWNITVDKASSRKSYIVQIDHTMAVEATSNIFKSGDILVAAGSIHGTKTNHFLKNIASISKTEIITNRNGVEMRKVKYDTTPAHYFMASLYAFVEMFMRPEEKARLSYVDSERILTKREENKEERSPFRMIKHNVKRRNRRYRLMR